MQKRRYQSDNLIQRKKKKRIILCFVFIILFLLIVFGISYISNRDFFKIGEIEINELRFVDSKEIDFIVKKEIEGKYFWLFSKSNSIIYPRNKIEQEIRDKYYSIKRVDTDFRGFKKIRVNIVEHDPVAKWCDSPVLLIKEPDHEGSVENALNETVIPILQQPEKERKSDTNCYFLNEKGKIFLEEPDLHTGNYVIFSGFIEGDPFGKNFATEEKFDELIKFTKLIRRLDVVPKEIWTKNGEVYTLLTESGAKLFIDDEDDIISVFRNLETVIEKDAINKAQFNNIDYIDLRFENRVFYKLK